MLNRAVIQPDPAVFIGMVADTVEAAARAPVAGRHVPAARGGGRDAADRPGRAPDDGEDADPGPVGAGPVAHDRERRPARSHSQRRARDDPARRGSTCRSPRTPWSCTAPRPGCAMAPPVPIWDAERHHGPAGSGRLSLLRRGAGRVRRGHPRRRRGEEPAVPGDALPQLARRLGPDEGARRPRLGVLRVGARHPRVGRRGACSTRRGSRPSSRSGRRSRRRSGRVGEHAEPGIARLAELAWP